MGAVGNTKSTMVPSLPPPCPKSPPEYPDLYGKRREIARVQKLEREISFLEDELKAMEGLQPASKYCKEVTDFVLANSDPLMPIKEKKRRSRCFWKWLCKIPCCCFKWSWLCCCCNSKCSVQLQLPRCSNCNPCGDCNVCKNCNPCDCCSHLSCPKPDCQCCSCSCSCSCPKPNCCKNICCTCRPCSCCTCGPCSCCTCRLPSCSCPDCCCSCFSWKCWRPKCPKLKLSCNCTKICCNPCCCCPLF